MRPDAQGHANIGGGLIQTATEDSCHQRDNKNGAPPVLCISFPLHKHQASLQRCQLALSPHLPHAAPRLFATWLLMTSRF
ncbi:hypothetical protein AGIG_G17530 [Arapaima gigas]